MATATKMTPSKKTPDAPRRNRAKTPAQAAKVPDAGDAQTLPGALKKKELIDAVAAATGQKRADVKRTIEATLTTLGREVAAGRSVQTPELGRLKVIKHKDTPGGPLAVCRFRGPRVRDAAVDGSQKSNLDGGVQEG
jgi:hypothetical protein